MQWEFSSHVVRLDKRIVSIGCFRELQVDDAEDVEVVSVLLDPPVPEGFDICTTDTLPGITNMACSLQVLFSLNTVLRFVSCS